MMQYDTILEGQSQKTRLLLWLTDVNLHYRHIVQYSKLKSVFLFFVVHPKNY
jgi:hypothetical protein